MQTAAQEWIELGREEGEVIGLQKGRSKQRRTIVQILQHRFLLSQEIAAELIKQLNPIENDDTLDALINESLQVLLFNDFLLRLNTALPSTTHQ